ncbi:MAG: SPFH domain-containing protein [Elusimicrobia bacterium]|nr:SPFH domain-containing protein [Elusimicrobiota bacterium]
MGFFDRAASQFIEIIEWTDDSSDTLAYRFPVQDREIKMGAQLIVRESQNAAFVNEGKLADVFRPGRFELATKNLPVLTALRSWPYGFRSPFKAEVYFFNMRLFTGLKWGTANPITVRDPEFGVARIRAFGLYALKIKDPAKLHRQVSGTSSDFSVSGIEAQLRGSIINRFSDLLAESKIAFVDLASHLEELSAFCRERLQPDFDALGLELARFLVENVSLPAAVEQVVDRKTGMGVVGGDMRQYAQFQAADSIKEAAQNPGGLAGAGAGLGVGLGMGQIFSDALKPGAPAGAACGKCGKAAPADARFCPDCGQPRASACPKCKAALSSPAKFCPQCGSAL